MTEQARVALRTEGRVVAGRGVRLGWGTALVAIAAVLGALLLPPALNSGRVLVPGAAASADSSTAVHLYNAWIAQMRTVAFVARPPYGRTKLERMQQVGEIRAQTMRAAGMAFVLLPETAPASSDLGKLVSDLQSIDGGIDDMLALIQSGYTGKAASQLAPADIRFVRRLISRGVLAVYPSAVVSAGGIAALLPRLGRTASTLATVATSRFSSRAP